MAEKLGRLPEVAKVRTLQSFVPKDQDEKLAIIDDASFFFENTLNPVGRPRADPGRNARGDRQDGRRALRRRGRSRQPRRRAGAPAGDRADGFGEGAAGGQGRSGPRAGHAAHDDASPGARSAHGRAVTLDTLPPSLKSAWVAPDGEVRIEVAPSGDGNDNAVLHRFVDAVRKAWRLRLPARRSSSSRPRRPS